MKPTDRLFDNSWARLGWVNTIGNRVIPFVQSIDHQAKSGDLVLDIERCPDHEHARFSLERPIVVPPELSFMVADFTVNARSCLDMAIQEITDRLGLPNKKPYFPIEDDGAAIGPNTRGFLRTLPDPISEVLVDLQPKYELQDFGRFDIPLDAVAVAIREVSNANKHRNITAVVRTWQSRGYTKFGDDVDVTMLHDTDESPWPTSDATVLEVRYPFGTVNETALLSMKPSRGLRLAFDDSGVRYGGSSWSAPILLSEYLDAVPKYVTKALGRLERTTLGLLTAS